MSIFDPPKIEAEEATTPIRLLSSRCGHRTKASGAVEAFAENVGDIVLVGAREAARMCDSMLAAPCSADAAELFTAGLVAWDKKLSQFTPTTAGTMVLVGKDAALKAKLQSVCV